MLKRWWHYIPLGTRSLLVGAHAVWRHPVAVWRAWWKLYGFPIDPRLYVAFAVHDWGYWGKPEMDGPQGEQHPIVGARIMLRLFERPTWYNRLLDRIFG